MNINRVLQGVIRVWIDVGTSCVGRCARREAKPHNKKALRDTLDPCISEYCRTVTEEVTHKEDRNDALHDEPHVQMCLHDDLQSRAGVES